MLPEPRMIANLAVTYRCNSRCGTCDIWRRLPDPGTELTVSEITGLLSENRDLLGGVEQIQVTGGEPFLREDLPEILAGIHGILPSCFVWVPTNGLLPGRVEEVAAAAVALGVPLGVSVSVDGCGAAHDAARGIEGAFDSASETLRRLSELKRAGLRGLTVGLTLTPGNACEVSRVIDLARGHDADFSLRLAHRSSEYYGGSAQASEDTHEVRRALRLAAEYSVERRGCVGSLTTLAYLEGTEASLRGVSRRRCTAGSGSFFLDPSGGVHPCLFTPSLGSIRVSGFRGVWGSEEAEGARKRVAAGDCPGCWVECEAYRDLDAPRLAAGVRWGLRCLTRFS